MIKGFEQPHLTEPVAKSHLQAMPALTGGLIAGVIMLIVPHASPWAGLTSFTPALLGRVVSSADVPVLGVIVMHLALSVIYGFIVSLSVIKIHELRAVVTGGVVGIVLYLLNLGVVSMLFPALRGNEASVLLTHVVFGLVAAGAYRGLLRRTASGV